ncbi:hypothetical protein BCR39DRAFT_562653 [Naematelia encephala]|uniref:Uncharacterized protein n=1 Tax=Naematelia encephala TaxID=71784 RepID=A0A1Y2AGK1_9TREE|nr:hypothetical protein BCR39DRAFT_562653 [Naematelia encephala]
MNDSVTTKAIYTVFTSPHHAPMPNHLPTLIVTPHGQPNQVLYTYLHTEENRVNYLLTPSPQGDLCVAKLFPPNRRTPPSGSSTSISNKPASVVRCEASRDLRWTIENTGVMSPIYKIVNQDDTPLYQISKPNPNAEFWTMFYFKYAGHQIPPRRVEFGKVAKNPAEKGGGTRITITGKSEDEKQVWQTLGVGNEDCVEWVVCCACLNLLDDQILQAAEKKNAANLPPASTAPIAPAATSLRPSPAASPIPRLNGHTPPSRGPGIASTAPAPLASNLAQAYRQNPPPQMQLRAPPASSSSSSAPASSGAYRPPLPSQVAGGGGMRAPPPGQNRPNVLSRAPPAGTGRRF